MSTNSRTKSKGANIRTQQTHAATRPFTLPDSSSEFTDKLWRGYYETFTERMEKCKRTAQGRKSSASTRAQTDYPRRIKPATRPLASITSPKVHTRQEKPANQSTYLRKPLARKEQDHNVTQIVARTAARTAAQIAFDYAAKKFMSKNIDDRSKAKRLQKLHMTNNPAICNISETAEKPSKIPIWKREQLDQQQSISRFNTRLDKGDQLANPTNMALLPRYLTVDMSAHINKLGKTWASIIDSLGPPSSCEVDRSRRLSKLIRACSESQIHKLFALPISFEYLSTAVMGFQNPKVLTEENIKHRDTLLAYDKYLATSSNNDPITLANHRFRIWQLYQDMRALELVSDREVNEVHGSSSCPERDCYDNDNNLALTDKESTQSDTSLQRKSNKRNYIRRRMPFRAPNMNYPVIYETSDEDAEIQDAEEFLKVNYQPSDLWKTGTSDIQLNRSSKWHTVEDKTNRWLLGDSDDEIEGIIKSETHSTTSFHAEIRRRTDDATKMDTYEDIPAEEIEVNSYNPRKYIEPSLNDHNLLIKDANSSYVNLKEIVNNNEPISMISPTAVTKKAQKPLVKYTTNVSVIVTGQRTVSRKARLVRRLRKVCTSWVLKSTRVQVYRNPKTTREERSVRRVSSNSYSSNENYLCPNCCMAGCQPTPKIGHAGTRRCRYQEQMEQVIPQDSCDVLRIIGQPPSILRSLLNQSMNVDYRLTGKRDALQNIKESHYEPRDECNEDNLNTKELPEWDDEKAHQSPNAVLLNKDIYNRDNKPSDETIAEERLSLVKNALRPSNTTVTTKNNSEESLCNCSCLESDEYEDVYEDEPLPVQRRDMSAQTSNSDLKLKLQSTRVVSYKQAEQRQNHSLFTYEDSVCQEADYCDQNNEWPTLRQHTPSGSQNSKPLEKHCYLQ